MSQLDDTILDALTHVTFPKGFAQAEPHGCHGRRC